MSIVLSISSHVLRGHVGNSAAAFTLQRFGHEVWALPTVILPHHPGHERTVPRHTMSGEAITDFVSALDRQGWLGKIDAVLIGYLGHSDQAEAVAAALRHMRAARPDVLVALDPIIGDDETLYVSHDIATAIRDLLLPLSDLITPNMFEFSWLAGTPASDISSIIASARQLAPCECLLTSAPGAPDNMARTLAITNEAAFVCDARQISHAAHGAGDLIAALYLGHRLCGKPAEAALAHASSALHTVLAATARAGSNELLLIETQDELVSKSTLPAFKLD